MKICISGWYFHKPLLKAIARAHFYPALVVGHRKRPTYGLPLVLTPKGCGLDFGCYQQYLMNEWDGKSDVLFMQDDGEIHDEGALHDIDRLSTKAEIDHAYIFRDEYDEFANSGHSSRAMWMRGSLLTALKAGGGFSVDWENEGDTKGRQANWALGIFHAEMQTRPKCAWVAIVPGLHMGRRGYIANEAYQYRRTGEGIVTPEGLT